MDILGSLEIRKTELTTCLKYRCLHVKFDIYKFIGSRSWPSTFRVFAVMLHAARPTVRVRALLLSGSPLRYAAATTLSAPKLGAPRAVGLCALIASKAFHSKRRLAARAGLGSASETEASFVLDGGYDVQPLEDGTGAWLAHRSERDVPGSGPGHDWVSEVFADAEDKHGANLQDAARFQVPGAQFKHRPRILVLYGSLRPSSFSRKLAFECARLLELLGADVRTFSSHGLPVRDPALEEHPKVQELRALSMWSEGHVWVSPEMHGCVTGAFKNQIDWLPLNTGSVRPTQGRTCVVLQVNGGSQSFNVVNELRRLARWMRMPCCTNQSSVPKAWQEFDDDGRMKAGCCLPCC